jgi:hypothetical protein
LEAWRRKVGHQDQLFGTRLSRVVDGPGDGIRLLHVWTAAGLTFDIAVDRGFDLYRAAYRGQNVDWVGPPGLRSRFAYEPGQWGWLRSFHGGLMTTCGLDHILFPIERSVPEYHFPVERNIDFGLHGRVANEGADIVSRELVAGNNGPQIRIRGLVTQAAVYGETLALERELTVPAFASEIGIIDTVMNRGFNPTRHEMLYHINLGYPLVDSGAVVDLDESRPGGKILVTEPQSGFVERVSQHDLRVDEHGICRASVTNTVADLALELTFAAQTLPRFNLWYMMAEGVYAIGLEPMSIRPEERRPDTLGHLAPGDRRRYELNFRFSHAPQSSSESDTSRRGRKRSLAHSS